MPRQPFPRCDYRQTAAKRIAMIDADELIFDENERGPQDDLRLQFEAVSKFSAEEKKVIKSVLEGLILKHEAKRWSSAS
jgi:hypothetical protein